MKSYPEVYIIILNFNSYNETIGCIESIENITYENYKIIIVDNDSKDDSVKVLRSRFPHHILLESKINLGYANGNNIGIKYAKDNGADYICILNNDVRVESNFLEPLIGILIDDDSAAMTGPCICEYTKPNTIQAMGANINLYTGLAQAKYKGTPYDDVNLKTIDVDYLGGACFVFKSSILDKIGYIPENYFLFFEETEFCLKTKKLGYKLICVKESKVYHKGSATISKFKGLSYFFLNRNRIVFMRRNANVIQKIIFSIYVVIEGIGRMILRREPVELFKFFIEGLKTDINKIDLEKVKYYVK